MKNVKVDGSALRERLRFGWIDDIKGILNERTQSAKSLGVLSRCKNARRENAKTQFLRRYVSSQLGIRMPERGGDSKKMPFY